VFRSFSVSLKNPAVTVGVGHSRLPGTIEIYTTAPRSGSAELLRVSVEGTNATGQEAFPPLSYTFTPSLNHATAVALEVSLAFKDFLVGRHRGTSGLIRIQFFVEGAQGASVLIPVEQFLRLYRGRGKASPDSAEWSQTFITLDSAETAALPVMSLKGRSDKTRSELAEKKRIAEEEAKKKEQERLAALAKAAEAAAAAKSGGAAPAAAVDKTKATISGGRTLLVYGSSTGNTTEVANMIKAELGDSVDHVKNITDVSPLDFGVAECLILGVPTWHIGEMQDDWAAALPDFEKASTSLAGKKLAVFGLGDGKGYADTYVDAMEELVVKFEKKGAKLVGLWPTDGYDFKKSKAIRNNKFMGLVIDVENQDDQSERRVKAWCNQLRTELLG